MGDSLVGGTASHTHFVIHNHASCSQCNVGSFLAKHAGQVTRDLLPCACKWACGCWCMSVPVHAHGIATVKEILEVLKACHAEAVVQVLSACHAGGTLMQNALAISAVLDMSALSCPYMVS